MKTVRLQWTFVRMVADLLDKAHELGYEVSFGDAYRSPAVKYGHKNSLHRKRLAIDLNLFKDGRYIRDDTGHRELGEWWMSIGGTWGGMNGNSDYNHYSLTDGTMTF